MAILAEHTHGELKVTLEEVHGTYRVKLRTTSFFLDQVNTASYSRAAHCYAKWVAVTLANAAPTTRDQDTLREIVVETISW